MDFNMVLGIAVILIAYSLTWLLLLKSIKKIRSMDYKKKKDMNKRQIESEVNRTDRTGNQFERKENS